MEKTSSPNSRFTVCRPFRQRCSAAQRVSVNVFFFCFVVVVCRWHGVEWASMIDVSGCLRMSQVCCAQDHMSISTVIYFVRFKSNLCLQKRENRTNYWVMSWFLNCVVWNWVATCCNPQPSVRTSLPQQTIRRRDNCESCWKKIRVLDTFSWFGTSFFGGKSTKSWYEGFLKWGYPKIIPNWTILVLKPMVLGIPPFKKPHHIASYSIISRQTSSASWRFRILWGNVSPGLLNPDN